MKYSFHLLLCFSLFFSSFSFGQSYQQHWKAIDSLEKKGLPESALSHIRIIRSKSTKEKNSIEYIKASIYWLKFAQQVYDDSLVTQILAIQKEMVSAPEPQKQITQSYLAEFYQLFSQANQWQFGSRTKVQTQDNPDFSTWDLQSIKDQAKLLYSQSLQNPPLLLQSKAIDFQGILTKEVNTAKLAPTLFDVLANRYVDYLGEEFTGLEQMEASRLEQYHQAVFQPGSAFLKTSLPSTDTSSSYLQVYSVFQTWLKLYVSNREVFADVDLRRLNWFKARQSANEAIKLRYESALIAFLKEYEDLPIFAEISSNLATSYRQNSQSFYTKRGIQTGKEDSESLLKARKVCQDAIAKFPEALMTPLCKLFLQDIEAPSYSYQVEEMVLPETPVLLNFTYKNLDVKGNPGKLFGRLVQVPNSDLKRIMGAGGYYSDEIKKAIVKLPSLKELSWTFPGETDLVSHSAEVMLPALPAGAYVLLVSSKSGFQNTEEIWANSFWCNSFGYSTADLAGEKTSFALLNRKTGRPIEGAKIEIYNTDYNYAKGSNREVLVDSKTTDKNGLAILEGDANKYNLCVFISYGSERYWSNRNLYFTKEQEQNLNQDQISLFTDRSIYRPGQTVFFKGIFTNQTVSGAKPLENRAVEVFLKDANFQDVSNLALKTNAFGSFHGSFVLPKGKLNGEFQLYTNYGQLAISVEEYKRPKFEAHFVPPAASFKLGDKLKLELEAKTFTGLPVENAKVELNITRSQHQIWFWYRGGVPGENAFPLSHSFKTTNSDGKLPIEIPLSAPADAQADDLFDFQVEATVTDPSGESHTTSYTLLVGSKAYRLQTNLGAEADIDTLKQFYIQALNSVGKSVKAVNGTVKVYAVQVPKKAFQKRFWPNPDRFVMDENTFKANFPDYAYKTEEERARFPKKQIQTWNFNTSNDSLITVGKLDGIKLLLLEFEGVLGLDTVRTTQFLELFASSKPQPDPNELLQARLLEEKVKLGSKLKIELSEFHGLPLLMEVFSGNPEDNSQTIVWQEWIETQAQGFQTKEISLQPEWGKTVSVVFSGYWGNRKLQAVLNPSIEQESHTLNIQVESFRDAMEPGKKETWRLKISDDKGEKIQSEVLATMYDASLDQFRPHAWNFSPFSLGDYVFLTNRPLREVEASQSMLLNYKKDKNPIRLNTKTYSNLNWFGFHYYQGGRYRQVSLEMTSTRTTRGRGKSAERKENREQEESLVSVDASTMVVEGDGIANGMPKAEYKANQQTQEKDKPAQAPIQATPRTNLTETAFFFPQLKTDEQGRVVLEFTAPEALTKWKFMALATSKNLQFAQLMKEAVTRKSIMVTPNWPRFFREGDTIVISTKINLLQDIPTQTLITSLQVVNPFTGENITSKVVRLSSPANFSSKTQGVCWWKLVIPPAYQAMELTIAAQGGDFTDAERITIPVVPNRMSVTETLPLELNPGQSKTFHLEKLENNSSSTLSSQSLKLEYTTNPAWLAIQCLPYLMEGEKECSEQVFNRFYANSLGAQIAHSNPKIKAVFEKWGNSPGKLEKALGELAETTPWLRNALSESEQKRRVAQLFDVNQLESEQKNALDKLVAMQTAKGGFPWFPGMPEDRYMTQHIVEGLSHLQVLGALKPQETEKVNQLLSFAFAYLDQELKNDYAWVKKENIVRKEVRINEIQLHYLYVRSLFQAVPFVPKAGEAHRFYTEQMEKYWTELAPYSKGLMALIELKAGQKNLVNDAVKSLKETAIKKDDLGMYWKCDNAWYWFSAPIETNALMVEVFNAVKDQESVNALTKWLLKNKQTNHWKSSKATADACYALLMLGGEQLETETKVKITVGKQVVNPMLDSDLAVEAGTGYFSKQWSGPELSNDMGKVSVQNPDGKTVSWGGLYWTYFEQLDKITEANTQLKIKKELFKQENTNAGPVLVKLSSGAKLQKGDKLKVRIELVVDRPMEYVKLTDMRAAAFEPTQTLSGGQFQDGLYYYQSPKDLSTDFFIHYLQKGNYVFEYPLSVQQSGAFSNGITTVECMYAPEFSSHSAGIRVKVEE
jgi:uncharacterized protein YfaS (alpha-2-macroglobulin family)